MPSSGGKSREIRNFGPFPFTTIPPFPTSSNYINLYPPVLFFCCVTFPWTSIYFFLRFLRMHFLLDRARCASMQLKSTACYSLVILYLPFALSRCDSLLLLTGVELLNRTSDLVLELCSDGLTATLLFCRNRLFCIRWEKLLQELSDPVLKGFFLLRGSSSRAFGDFYVDFAECLHLIVSAMMSSPHDEGMLISPLPPLTITYWCLRWSVLYCQAQC